MNENTIYVQLLGNRGNILFGLALGHVIKKQNKVIYFVKEDSIDRAKKIVDLYENNATIILYDDVPKGLPNYFEEYSIIYTPLPILNHSCVIHGYRQSPKYWGNYYDEIKNKFQPTQDVINKIYSLFPEYNFSEMVCVHVRTYKKDGKHVDDFLGVVPLHWYKMVIKRKFPDCKKFLIISDDIDECKKYFTEDIFYFLDKRGENDDVNETIDFYTPTLCAHNIISNSTFTWWASFLNNKENRIVAPKPFFRVVNKCDIYLPNMEVMEIHSNKCCIVIPVYKLELTANEYRTIRRCVQIWGNKYDIYLMHPSNLDVSIIDKLCNYSFQKFPVGANLSSRERYSDFLVTSEFYLNFIDYNYTLIYQLDSGVLYDNLEYFIDMDYDYIGGPHFWLEKWSNGNGGFSLRKNIKLYSLLNLLEVNNISLKYNDIKVYEDIAITMVLNQFLNIAPLETAFEFAYSDSDVDNVFLKHNKLPMGYHGHGIFKDSKIFKDAIEPILNLTN